MGLLAYIFIGLIAGAIAKALFYGGRSESSGIFGTIFLGIVGAVVGGWVWNLLLGAPSPVGLDGYSLLVASIGACLTLGVLKLIRR
jgi:uncharacterized membrane protein YeaQ/YmgE (transglycosylase-associated protein family)